jgi:hypothetical protein
VTGRRRHKESEKFEVPLDSWGAERGIGHRYGFFKFITPVHSSVIRVLRSSIKPIFVGLLPRNIVYLYFSMLRNIKNQRMVPVFL